jgi:hydrogenase expression/formation protein HypC
MCRSTVARVVAIDGSDAIVDFDGVRRRASVLLTPDVAVGDHVLIGLGTVLGRVAPSDLDALRALDGALPTPTSPTTQGGSA